MLQVHDLRKTYGERLLFDRVAFALTRGERLGLVGRNGSGKTTLLRLILGEEEPDAGTIQTPRHYSIGHLSQHLSLTQETVLAEASLGLEVRDDAPLESHRAEETLMGLGFRVSDFTRHPSEFSGGYQMRLQLAKVLLSDPNLLLLDEPSNYLDIVSVRWLRGVLRSWPGELILITHDREFMDSVVTHTMAIHRSRVRSAQGGTGKLYELLLKDEETQRQTFANDARARRQAERFINRFRAKASKARQVQSRIKMLKKRPKLEILPDQPTLGFQFRAAPFPGKFLLHVEGLAFGYDEREPPLFEDLSFTVRKGDRIAVIGKNGRGKTTLLNLLAGELTPKRGTVKPHENLKPAHFGQSNIDRLQPSSTVEEEIQAASPTLVRREVRGLCGAMMFEGDEALKRVQVLSGGERARVLLGKLLVSPANLLLLDEPSNHLDMESTDALIEAVGTFQGSVVLVTHNEQLLRAVSNRLIVFDRGTVRFFDGGYDEFLERVGWEDEGRDAIETPRSSRSSSPRRERRRQRAEIVADRSRTLRPLEQRMGELEESIDGAEKRVEAVNRELCDASEEGRADALPALSQELQDLKTRIDAWFEEYQRLSAEHEAASREFDRRLEE